MSKLIERGRAAQTLGWGVVVASFMACAPRDAPREKLSSPELRTQMLAALPGISGYLGEARLTYFGKDGRIKATATLAVRKPTFLRYELHGPHGGVLEAFATDGVELQLVDFKRNRFVYGPVRPDTLDRLLPLTPLKMGAEDWVRVLCGELVPPAEAEIRRDGDIYRTRWQVADITQVLEIDAKSTYAKRAATFRGETLQSEVVIASRAEGGLPQRLELRVPAENVTLQIVLREVELNPNLADGIFRLEPPESAERIDLSEEGE